MCLRLIVVFLVFLVNAFAASYKGIRVGQNITDLPEQIRCEAVFTAKASTKVIGYGCRSLVERC